MHNFRYDENKYCATQNTGVYKSRWKNKHYMHVATDECKDQSRKILLPRMSDTPLSLQSFDSWVTFHCYIVFGKNEIVCTF